MLWFESVSLSLCPMCLSRLPAATLKQAGNEHPVSYPSACCMWITTVFQYESRLTLNFRQMPSLAGLIVSLFARVSSVKKSLLSIGMQLQNHNA